MTKLPSVYSLWKWHFSRVFSKRRVVFMIIFLSCNTCTQTKQYSNKQSNNILCIPAAKIFVAGLSTGQIGQHHLSRQTFWRHGHNCHQRSTEKKGCNQDRFYNFEANVRARSSSNVQDVPIEPRRTRCDSNSDLTHLRLSRPPSRPVVTMSAKKVA